MDIKEYFREEGRQKGRKEGIQTGIRKRNEQVVLNMLKEKADLNFICKVTGLSEKEIKKLKKRK